MRRRLDDRYELDDDPARVDVDVTHAFLTESYWAEGRTRETVERLVSHAARVIGIYRREDGRLLSCGERRGDLRLPARCVRSARARGLGLGVELVREAVELGPHADLPWHLGTRDAHELYERFGFGPPDLKRQMRRPGTRRS